MLTIIDTGCANLSSVKFAFDRLDIKSRITDDISSINSAERLILPGVGSAPYAMKNIKDKGLIDTLQKLDQPLMGICLGMQLLFDSLEEGGKTIHGLGILPGHVGRLDTGSLPSPHMGWNQLSILEDNLLTWNIQTGSYAYFVHSYALPVCDVTIAKSGYGAEFSAIIAHKNVYGCQFHPERSSAIGARILRNFAEL